MLMLLIAGAFLIPDGTYNTAHAFFSGATHIVFAIIQAPNEPPKQQILSYPRAVMTSLAHLP